MICEKNTESQFWNEKKIYMISEFIWLKHLIEEKSHLPSLNLQWFCSTKSVCGEDGYEMYHLK